jgi:hypothetical protein
MAGVDSLTEADDSMSGTRHGGGDGSLPPAQGTHPAQLTRSTDTLN